MQMKQPAVSRPAKNPFAVARVEPLRRRPTPSPWARGYGGGARAKARPVCQYGLQEPGHLRRPVELAPACHSQYSERNCLSVEPLSTGLILLRLVYLPRTRGQLWLGALEAGYWFYVGDAYRRPQIAHF